MGAFDRKKSTIIYPVLAKNTMIERRRISEKFPLIQKILGEGEEL